MFLAVALNPALDVTYEVPRFGPGATHRVGRPRVRAGGKGVNVARVLHAVGETAHVIGFAGGQGGQVVENELMAAGVAATLVPVAGETRRTVTVVETATGVATMLSEPGPAVTAAEWRDFTDRFTDLARKARVVVLTGSLPPGLPADAYAVLIRAAGRAGGAPVLLDADGPALREGARAAPTMVKPNADELSSATGHADPGLGAAALRELGAGAVVVSQGAEGVTAVTNAGAWRASSPEPIVGNPTGAGDAAAAALARGMAAGHSSPGAWPELLRDAVALSAAAVAAPVAGEIDHETYARLRPLVQVVPARVSPPGQGPPAAPRPTCPPAAPPFARESR
ncbi:MAG TPA: 1-phosphofructokinase family hexose kinase [Streptosporangiaceae bacterium]|nr:1-phosphofructokinase family hexose kinase [Streptosporangiaceae bacterium]